MTGAATEPGGRTPTAAPSLWRQWFHARRPQAGRGLNADGIGEADFGYAVAEIGVVAVTRVGQCDFGGRWCREAGPFVACSGHRMIRRERKLVRLSGSS